nr:hypothetical protein [Mycoplasmopsis bovis]
MIKDENWRKLTFTKNFELSKTRVHSEMKVYTTELKLLALIIATKVKTIKRLNLHQNYSFRQIIEYLRSYKVEVINDTEWKKQGLKYVQTQC